MLFWIRMLAMVVMFASSLTLKTPEVYWMMPLTGAVYVLISIHQFCESREDGR